MIRKVVFEALWVRVTYPVLEGAVFGSCLGRLLRPVALYGFARRLTLLGQGFDDEFYLRQIAGDRQRRRAARAPLLHYALLGWRTGLSPHPRFDPAFYRRQNPRLEAHLEPTFHHLHGPSFGSAPRNEVEARDVPLPWRPSAGAVLTLHHARGGGSSRLLDLYERRYWEQGMNVLRLRAVPKSASLGAVEDMAVGRGALTRVFDLAAGCAPLVEFARARGVKRLMVNHWIDRPPAMMEWVREIGACLGVSYDVVLHDYFALCPRVDMVTGAGVFCEAAPPETCARCVRDYGSEVSEFDPISWRADHLAFLAGADRIIAPSDDLARRMQPHVAKPVVVWPPEQDGGAILERVPRLTKGEDLRLAILGALNVSKGLRVVQALAEVARCGGAPLSLSVLGPASERLPPAVRVSGPYHSSDLDRLIADSASHAVFLPAIWPETWSFVLTDALRLGLPVIAFDIGAPAERLRRLTRGHLLPLELATNAPALLATLLKLRDRWIDR